MLLEAKNAVIYAVAGQSAVQSRAPFGNVAAFVASDRARSMTAATANISGGALID